MAYHSGYLVDLSSYKLDDGQTSSWIMLFPYGDYKHPMYGDIKIDPEIAKQYADNINNNVRGQDLNVDYDHQTGIAAGWIRKAEVRDNGLYGKVEWTAKAAEHIRNKEYKYFSPDFTDEWTHPSTNVNHKNVIFGGGLTNRPFLKGIAPMNLSERYDLSEKNPTGPNEGGSMKPEDVKALAKKLGLKDDATEADVMAKLTGDSLKFSEDEPPKNDPPAPTVDDANKKLAEAQEAFEAAKKLAESKPELAAVLQLTETLMKNAEIQGQLLADQATVMRGTAIDAQVNKLCAEVKEKSGVLVSIPVRDELKKTLAGLPKQLDEQVSGLVSALLSAAVIPAGERGKGKPGLTVLPGGKTGDEFLDVVNTKLSEDKKAGGKLTDEDAFSICANEYPDEYKAHRLRIGMQTEEAV